jgi:cellulose synthase operon protein C
MSVLCQQIGPFVDGELSANAAALFRQHLGKCTTCPKELEKILVLDTLAEQALGGPVVQPGTVEIPAYAEPAAAANRPRPPTGKTPGKTLLERAWAWRPSKMVWFPVAAAAVGIIVALFRPGAGDGPWTGSGSSASAPIVALELPRCRTTLGRVADDGYAQPVPCRVTRAGNDAPLTGVPRPSLRALAQLEERADYQAIAAVFLGEKDLAGAELYLGKAGSSAAVDNDKAVLALERGNFAEALRLADAVLARAPGNKAAAWNRAVALEHLDRRAEAAQQFAAIAAGGEPGWAEQARARAAALTQPVP